MNSSLVKAYLMHWSMVFISRNFQLSPFTAEQYSRLFMPLALLCFLLLRHIACHAMKRSSRLLLVFDECDSCHQRASRWVNSCNFR